MSWLDALLGRIRNAGVDLALGSGLNFLAPLIAARNPSTGFVDIGLTDSTSIVGGQRAALTGVVEAPLNTNTTTFGSGVASASILNNAGRLERAALTGEVTAAQNTNNTAVVRSTDYAADPWTGDHLFNANAMFGGTLSLRNREDQTLAADANNVDMSAKSVLRLVGNGFALTGMVAKHDGQMVLIINADSGDPLDIDNESASSTAVNRITTPGAVTFTLPVKGCVWARYDSNNQRWYLVSK